MPENNKKEQHQQQLEQQLDEHQQQHQQQHQEEKQQQRQQQQHYPLIHLQTKVWFMIFHLLLLQYLLPLSPPRKH